MSQCSCCFRLYPFYEASKFAACETILAPILAEMEPFELKFTGFNKFEHGKSCTVYCVPETSPPNALQKLQTALVQAFPECNDLSTRSDEGFIPHLTVGQWKTAVYADEAITHLSETWTPTTMTVDKVKTQARLCVSSRLQLHMIARDDQNPFRVAKVLTIGSPKEMKSATDAIAPTATPRMLTSTVNAPKASLEAPLVTSSKSSFLSLNKSSSPNRSAPRPAAISLKPKVKSKPRPDTTPGSNLAQAVDQT